MFSTIVMVQQGKTYGNFMVDLNPSNHKLRERAIGMVSAIAGVDRDSARATLESADFDVKTAAVMLRLGVDRDAAAERVGAARGRLRAALGE
jgi:N-acetylmuramic acid 6-phosphate etherase